MNALQSGCDDTKLSICDETVALRGEKFDEYGELEIDIIENTRSNNNLLNGSIPAYAILSICVLAASSIGICSYWKSTVDSVTLSAWKTQSWTMFIFPLSIYEFLALSSSQRQKIYQWNTIKSILFASLAQLWWSASLFIAFRYTSVVNALLFNNAHGILLVLYRIFTRKSVLTAEYIGVALGMLGGTISTLATSNSVNNHNQEIVRERLGDLIAFSGSFAAAICLQLTKDTREILPPGIFSFLLNGLNLPFYFILPLCSAHFDYWSASHGIFGWIHSGYIGIWLYLGIVCGCFGGTGLILLFKVLPGLIISLVMLLEPIVGSYLTAAVGFTPFPNPTNLIGALTVILGIASISSAHQIQFQTVTNS